MKHHHYHHEITAEQEQYWGELQVVRKHMRRVVVFLVAHVAFDIAAIIWVWQR